MMNSNDPFSAGFWQSTTSQASAAAVAAGFFQGTGGGTSNGHNNGSSTSDAFAQQPSRLFVPGANFDQFNPNTAYRSVQTISAASGGGSESLFATASANPGATATIATPVINGSGMTASAGTSTGFPHFTSFPTTAQYHPFVNFGLGAAAGNNALNARSGFSQSSHSPASSLMPFATAAARAVQSSSTSMLSQLKPSQSVTSLNAQQSQLQQQHTAATPPANTNDHLNLFDLSNNVVIASSSGAPTSVISTRNDHNASASSASSTGRHDSTNRGTPMAANLGLSGEIGAGLGFQFLPNRHNLNQNLNTNLMAQQQTHKLSTSNLTQFQQQHFNQQLERSQSQSLLLKHGTTSVGQGFLTGGTSKLSPVPSVVKIPTESILLGSPRETSSSSLQQQQQQQQQQSSQTSCQVCHLAASNGLHFGARTCAACAAFFRRSISDQKRYICKRSQRCVIRPGETQGYRKMCRNCRMKRCLEIGMLPENVQNKRHRREFYFVDTLESIPEYNHQSSSHNNNTQVSVTMAMTMDAASSSPVFSAGSLAAGAATTVLRPPMLAITTSATTSQQIAAAMAMNAAMMKSSATDGLGGSDSSSDSGHNPRVPSRPRWEQNDSDLNTIAGLGTNSLMVKTETDSGGLKMDPFERLLANAVSSTATSSFLNPLTNTNNNNNTSVITSPSLAFGLNKAPTLEPQLAIQQASTGLDNGLGAGLGSFDPWRVDRRKHQLSQRDSNQSLVNAGESTSSTFSPLSHQWPTAPPILLKEI